MDSKAVSPWEQSYIVHIDLTVIWLCAVKLRAGFKRECSQIPAMLDFPGAYF